MAKIAVANFYEIHPVGHGGQRRIFFLSRELSRDHDVTIISVSRGRTVRCLEFSSSFREIQVPAAKSYVDFERDLHASVPMTADVAYAMKWMDCRLYQGVLQEQMKTSQVAISEHPYSFPALLKAMVPSRRIPLIYNSQNVELRQKAPVLGGRDDLVKVVRSVENAAIQNSAAIIACSEIDREHFIADYGASPPKVSVVENGVDAHAALEITSDQVRDFKRELLLENRFVAVFGGSLHFPNIAAVDAILRFARALPDIVFVILGSICTSDALSGSIPPNVLPVGAVSEREKWLCFAISDLALNPMTQGSGSNIKMFEYAAAGLPTLSTNFGARATGLEAGVHYIEAEIEDFPARLAELARDSSGSLADVGNTAKAFVVKRADWSVIGDGYRKLVASILERKAPSVNG